MEHQEPDHAQLYQRKMQALYDAATNFKRDFFPADPFDGVLVNAADLHINELVLIYRAAEKLEAEGNAPFLNNLIMHRDHACLPPLVRVNPLWVDARKQRTIQVCELLYSWYYETRDTFDANLFKIVKTGDPQLLKYVQQVEETLNVSWLELMPVSVKVIEDSPTISY